MEAIDLEKYIIDCSPELIKLIVSEVRYKSPIAIGRHPILGLFILCTQGQGPMILWCEWEQD